MNRNIFFLILIIVSMFTYSSCDKMLDFEPEGEVLAAEAIQNASDVQAVLNSCYDVLANSFNGRYQNLGELLSDNLARPQVNDDFLEIWNRDVNFFNGTVGGFFGEPYIAIYRVNMLFTLFNDIDDLTDAEKTRIEAEGKFVRAISNYMLVSLFAQPYGFTPDNSHPGITIRTEPSREPMPRNTVQEVYDIILEDLEFAENNLPEVNGNYATKDAARALLAKIYFQMSEYQIAANYATQVISSNRYTLLQDLNRYVQNSVISESIFSTISTSNIDNRSTAFRDNYRPFGTNVPACNIQRSLYNQIIQDTNDLRIAWFEILNEGEANEAIALRKFERSTNGDLLDFVNIPVLHLTDLKLLRAEALARSNGDLSIARQDINDIIARSYKGNNSLLAPNAGRVDVIERAQYERRVEMLGEGDWVHHLKRRGVEGENIIVRSAIWSCNGMVLQFPVSENTANFEMNPEGGC